MKKLLCILGIVLLSGCSSFVPAPEAPDVTEARAIEAWAKVLKKYVDNQGRINFKGVGADARDLNTFVRYISKATPDSFKTPEQKLAFYLNAYNALSMFNVIASEYPTDLDGTLKRARFFYFKKFEILGEKMSLYTFENDFVRKLSDPRVHVALNCMSAGCPRLPNEPFLASKIESQLEREANKFYNEERNVRTEDAKKEVYISEILSFFTEDFLKKKPTLIEYVNQYRKTKVPADYKVKFIPYDWTIYRQP